ncbi:MAG: hypothetical protein LBH96_04535 [Candidatus Peribacteria bacterium]|nr:hypothetical protein [Candidatus Peribacteria bacterium]
MTEALAKKDEEIKKLKEAHNSDLQKAKEQQETFEKRRKEQEVKQETFEKRLKEQEAKLEAKEKEIKDIYIKNNHTSRPPTTKPKTNKQTNFSRNPVNRVVGTTASIVGGVGSFIHRRNAKMQEIGAEPSQLFMKSFWKDI